MTTDCQNDKKKSKIQTYLKAAALIVALAGLANCSEKEIVEGLKPLGKVTEGKNVDKAIDDVRKGTHIYYAKPGQVVEYEGNYRADMSGVTRIDTVVRTYKGYTETAESIVFHLLQDYYEFSRSGEVTNEKHSEVNLEMKKLIETLTFSSKQAGLEEAPSENKEEQEPDYCVRPGPNETKFDCIKYFNLVTYESVEAVPAKAQARENCGNVPGCILPVHIVQFDQVKFLGDKIVDKSLFKFSFSKTIPALMAEDGFPPINNFCISKLIQNGGTSYFLTQCNVLRDLKL